MKKTKNRAQVGVIGGSGLYSSDAIKNPREIRLKTPFGAHEFNAAGVIGADRFALPASDGRVAATQALGGFFTPRVAGLARLRAARARLAFQHRLRQRSARLPGHLGLDAGNHAIGVVRTTVLHQPARRLRQG